MSEVIPMRKIRYLGSSMSPTLRSLEILWVRPYTDRIPRCGDVVVFSSSTGTQLVAHRIVSRVPGGFRVQGDNNPNVDSELVGPGNIVGQVVYAQRGTRKRCVHGGRFGQGRAMARRVSVGVVHRVRGFLSGPYHLLVRGKLLPRLLPRRCRPRVVLFSRRGAPQLQLLWGKRSIGSYRPDTDRWKIDPPFRLFIDEGELPRAPAK